MHRSSRRLIVILLGTWVAACSSSAGRKKNSADAASDAAGPPPSDAGEPQPDSAPPQHVLAGITVTPANPIVQLDLNATGSQAFTATGSYADGTSNDISSQATWTLSDAQVGTMSGATLNIPAFATATADVSTVTASLNGVVGNAQITVVAYRKSGPKQDFFFVHQDQSGAQTQALDFSTAIRSLDTFFLMDTTGSMTNEIKNLQSALNGTVIPGIQSAVSDSQFGVGALEDFPIAPYGNSDPLAECNTGLSKPDQPFTLVQTITSDVIRVQAGVNALLDSSGQPIGCGGDWPEAGIEAIYQAATGEGLAAPAPTGVPTGPPGVGGVGFRQDTMPVIVTITDADSHAVGATGTCTISTSTAQEAYSGAVASFAHTRAQTKTALGKICARVVGIAAIQASFEASCQPLGYLQDLATATGARVPPAAWDVGTRPAGCAAGQCCTDFNGAGRAPDTDGLCPVVFKVNPDGTGVSQSVVTGIQMLTRFASFDVPTDKQGQTTDTNGNPLPSPHTTADFIKAITPTSFTLPASSPPGLPTPTFDTTTFHKVTPGTTVSFNVNAFNDFVPQTSQPQLFRATIRVLAGGCTPLDTRNVLILVPPKPN